jgi:hypothetical protein
MLQLANGFGFDLPDPLASDLEDTPDLLKGIRVSVTQPVPQANDFTFAVRKRFEQGIDFLPQNAVIGIL